MHRRFLGSGRVTFLGGTKCHRDGSSHLVTSGVSGETVRVDVRRRVVDATYLSPTISATTRPPFGVAHAARLVAINGVPRHPRAGLLQVARAGKITKLFGTSANLVSLRVGGARLGAAAIGVGHRADLDGLDPPPGLFRADQAVASRA